MMNITSRAVAPRDEADLKEISNFLLSNEELSGNSILLKKYEKLLCELFNVNYAIAVSSGTAAIHCALVALEVTKGDEIIVPVTAAIMSAIPILALGATPVFVDCQYESFAISIDDLKNKISSKTKAVISVPMWGYPTYSKELEELTSIYNVPVIEDAAQAIGTLNHNKFEGTNSIIGCFSTHELKLISTGEGGFILTNCSELANKCRTFSKIGFDANNIKEASYGINIGLNYKLNALTAALGCSQIKKVQKRLNIRRRNAYLWMNYLLECKALRHIVDENISLKPNYYGLVLLLDTKISKKELNFSEILKSYGISTDIFRYKYKMLPQYPIFRNYYSGTNSSMKKEFSNATNFIPKLVVLPTHEEINEKIIKEASEIISKCIEHYM